MLRPRTISSLLPMLLLCASLVSAQTKTVSQLVADLEHGDKSALVELIAFGNAGNADAQFNLGGLYLDGKVVPKDIVGAANWYKKAAEQGLAIDQTDVCTSSIESITPSNSRSIWVLVYVGHVMVDGLVRTANCQMHLMHASQYGTRSVP